MTTILPTCINSLEGKIVRQAFVLDRDYATHNAAFTGLRYLMVPASDILRYLEGRGVTSGSHGRSGQDQQSGLRPDGVAVSLETHDNYCHMIELLMTTISSLHIILPRISCLYNLSDYACISMGYVDLFWVDGCMWFVFYVALFPSQLGSV